MPRKLKYSEKAERDIDEILEYTLETWGPEQAQKYLSGLKEKADKLVGFPSLGEETKFDVEGMRKLNYQSHEIYYLATNESITILRVVHSNRDAKKLFNK